MAKFYGTFCGVTFFCKSIITKFSGNIDQITSFHANVQAYSSCSIFFTCRPP